jgi:hypothetical protein
VTILNSSYADAENVSTIPPMVSLTTTDSGLSEFKIVTMNYLKSQNLILKTTQTTDKHEAVVSESVSVYQNSSKLVAENVSTIPPMVSLTTTDSGLSAASIFCLIAFDLLSS